MVHKSRRYVLSITIGIGSVITVGRRFDSNSESAVEQWLSRRRFNNNSIGNRHVCTSLATSVLWDPWRAICCISASFQSLVKTETKGLNQ